MWTGGISREGNSILNYCIHCGSWVFGPHDCATSVVPNNTYSLSVFQNEEVQLLREIRDLLKQLIAKEPPL